MRPWREVPQKLKHKIDPACAENLAQYALAAGFDLSGTPEARARNTYKTKDWFKGK